MPENKVTRLRPTRLCPICAKPSVHSFHPFCSIRCANIDLGKWLTGAYAIPSEIGEEDDEFSEDETGVPPTVKP